MTALAIAAAVESFRPSLVARSTGHQAVLLGASSAIGYAVGSAIQQLIPRRGPARGTGAKLLALGTAAAVPVIALRVRQEGALHADWDAEPLRPVAATAQGTAIAGALVLGAKVLRRAVGGNPALGAAAAGAALAAAPVARRSVVRRVGGAAAHPDPAFAEPPDNPRVSGGPGSLIPYPTHTREGARFVHLAPRGRTATDPIRVFVGVANADTPQQRVALAVRELERLGAFERSALLAVSPAGTGYANNVPVEALELLTDGDCATVVVQYGVVPSMFARPLVPLGAQTYSMLVAELVGRGPRLLSYGESLGAQCAQQALLPRWRADGSFAGIDAALFVGTPSGTGIRALGGESRPAVVRVDRWQDLPQEVPPHKRVFLLDHDADPVTLFDRSLLWSRPEWLRQRPRGRGVPEAMAWRPGLTYLQVAMDVARATQATAGRFTSHGHDYRADLPALVRAAFAPSSPVDQAALMRELVRSETRRVELLRAL